MATCSLPDNFIQEVLIPENGIHHEFQVMPCSRVAMQVNASGRLQQSLHFKNSYRHVDQIRLHRITMHFTSGFNQRMERGMLVGNIAVPLNINVRKCPGVFELGTGRLAADGSRIVVVGIERRIKIDQIDMTRIHFPHHLQIVADEYGAVFPVLPVAHNAVGSLLQ